jgi:hypothetical protein
LIKKKNQRSHFTTKRLAKEAHYQQVVRPGYDQQGTKSDDPNQMYSCRKLNPKCENSVVNLSVGHQQGGRISLFLLSGRFFSALASQRRQYPAHPGTPH